MYSRTDCPVILRTKQGREYAKNTMDKLGMKYSSEKDRTSFYTMFNAWRENHSEKDFPDNIDELKEFNCSIEESGQLDLFKEYQGKTFGEKLVDEMKSKKKSKEMLRELTSSQVFSFAKIIAQFYSATITNNIEALKNTPFGDVFTGDMVLDRQILVTKFGSQYTPKAILESVRQAIIDSYGTVDAVVSTLKLNPEIASLSDEEFNKKVESVYENAEKIIRHFDSIVPYSASFIKSSEPVSILGTQNEIVDTFEEDMFVEFDTREHWQIEHLEQSAWSTLDPAVKQIINQIEDVDQNGKPTINELGKSEFKDSRTIHATLLSIIGDVVSDNDMIPALIENKDKYPWLSQICDVLCGKNTNSIKLYTDDNPQNVQRIAQNIQALFWKNFHKPFMRMATLDTVKGLATLKVHNDLEHSEALYERISNNIYELKPESGSIYKVGGSLYDRNYLSILKSVNKDTELYNFFNAETSVISKDTENIKKIYDILKKLGIDIPFKQFELFFKTASKQKRIDLRNIIYNGFFNKNTANNQAYQGLLKNKNQSVFSAFNSKYKELAKLLSYGSEVNHENSVTVTLDGKSKTMFSNTYPSLMLDMISCFKQPKDKVREFIEREYLYDFHFNRTINNKIVIPNIWLRELYEGNMQHNNMFELLNLLGSNGKTYMTQEDFESQANNLLMFFTGKSSIVNGYKYTYYPVGTFADAKSIYYLRNKVRSIDECIEGMVDMILTEVDHIKYVQAKQKAIERTKDDVKHRRSSIEYFDEKQTLPSLPEVDVAEFIKNLNDRRTNTSKRAYIKEVITETLNDRFENFVEDLTNDHIIENSDALTNLFNDKNNNKEELLKEYFYNTTLANACIDNMFIMDYTMFRDTDMKQKRFKFLYSPYSTAYTHCYMFEGDNIVDRPLYLRKNDSGIPVEFSILLTDRYMPSPSLSQVRKTLDQLLKDGIINKNQYNTIINGMERINLADGQCYRSVKSYDRLIDMIGQGQNQRTHEALELIRKSYTDPSVIMSRNYWEAVFNVFKPLVSGYEKVDTGIGPQDMASEDSARYAYVKAPIMHKNSEFLLLAVYNAIQGLTTQSPKLRALNRFMEDFDIDKIQFESASKISNHGVININEEKRVFIEDGKLFDEQYNEVKPSEDDVYYDINTDKYYAYDQEDGLYEMDYEQYIYETLALNCGLYDEETGQYDQPRQIQFNDGYNNNYIHATPLTRWGIISNVPEHLLDHYTSNLGTQFMKIVEEDKKAVDENGNPIMLDVNISGENVKLTVDQVHDLFQEVLVDYVQKAFAELDDQFNNPVKLKEFILEEMSKQSIYNDNLEECLRIDPVTKRFDISLLNPIRSNQFVSFCASLIRKKMIQHSIRQGLLPQVSAFGLEDSLQLRYFTDEINGHRTLVFTNKEWIGTEKVDPAYEKDLKRVKQALNNCSYKEYQQSVFGQAKSVAYMEIATPLFDNIFKKFIDKQTGLLDEEKLFKSISPEVLYALGYRIPTEAKHSMIPVRVKKFLPFQNASCVMMAIDWVFMSGSDFDIDKLFTVLPELEMTDNTKKVIDEIIKTLDISDPKDKRLVGRIVNHIVFGYTIDNNTLISDFYKKVASELSKYEDVFKIATIPFKVDNKDYESIKSAISTNNKAANNNLLLALGTSMLQAKDNLQHILTPNSIEHVKASSTIIRILTNPENKITKDTSDPKNGKISLEDLKEMLQSRSDKELLKKYLVDSKVLAPNDPRLRSLEHYRNMTGLNLTALFAVFRAFLPVVQKTAMTTRDTFMLNNNRSVVNNFGSVVNEKNIDNDYISDLISEYIAAAVDNAKDPRLAFLHFNTVTAPFAVFLTMRGYTTTEIALFLNQPIVWDVVSDYIKGNKRESLSRIAEKYLDSFEDVSGFASAQLDGISSIALAQALNESSKPGFEPDDKFRYFQKRCLEEFAKIIPVVNEFNNYSGIERNSTVANAVPSNTAVLEMNIAAYGKLLNLPNSKRQLNGTESLLAGPDENPADRFEAELREDGLLESPTLLQNVDFKTTTMFRHLLLRLNNKINTINLREDDINNLSLIAQTYMFAPMLDLSNDKSDFKKNVYTMLAKLIKAQYNVDIDINDPDANRYALMYGMPLLVSLLKSRGILSKQGDILSYMNVYYEKSSDTMSLGIYGKNRQKDVRSQITMAWDSLYENNRDLSITVGLNEIKFDTETLANALLLYNIIKGGIVSSYRNFLFAYPEGREANIPNYREMVASMGDDILSDAELDNVIEQYIQNFPTSACCVKNISLEKFAEITGQQNQIEFIPDSIIIHDRTTFNTFKSNSTDIYPYFNIIVGNTVVLYRFEGKGIWRRIPVLGNNGNYIETGRNVSESGLEVNRLENIQPEDVDIEMQKYEAGNMNVNEDQYVNDAVQKETDMFSEISDIEINALSSVLSSPAANVAVIVYNEDQEPQDEDKTGMKICSIKY